MDGKFALTEINSNPIMTLGLYYIVPRCLIFIAFMVVCNNIFTIISGSLEKAQLSNELEQAKIAAEKFEELLKKTLEEYHDRRATISPEEATQAQNEAIDEIIKNATQQALDILAGLGEDKESFRKLGLTFEEKAFYDILMHLRDKYNFEYGEDKKVGNLIINDKCKSLAQKIKELIDVQSSFTDWLNNSNVRAELNQKIFFCLVKNGYPPQYNDEVFDQVMEQVENFKTYN